MELTGSVNGLIKLLGGGSDVTIEPILLDGVEIMEITVDGVVYYIYAPEPGDNVSVTPIQLTGTKIATITIGENSYDIYSPGDTVSVTPIQLTGTKIATISVNDVPVDIYAPSSGIVYSTDEHVIGSYLGKTLYERTFTGLTTYTNGDSWVEIGGIDASTWEDVVNVEIYCNSSDVNNKLTRITLGEARVFNGNVQVTTSVSYNRQINVANMQYTKI